MAIKKLPIKKLLIFKTFRLNYKPSLSYKPPKHCKFLSLFLFWLRLIVHNPVIDIRYAFIGFHFETKIS